ncbi:hypothetical protein QBC47DRAFT_389044 [Echria macrotheca]|uniref:Uncharacterized protein n=1 Tax=Echria macrotheca TaxID=438768 RepID=A0AAJ0B905_9PEZI|nr:hypothetical protein QBC47DRAFT_389044 [Echria macrotheca]
MKGLASIVLLSFVSVALGHEGHGSLSPSPTESVGCVSHGDHWHCEGPRVTPAGVMTTFATSSVTIPVTAGPNHHHDDDDDHDHDHDDDHDHAVTSVAGAVSLKPSPTESVGCTAHGDHWHCLGPVVPTFTGTSGAAVPVGAAATGGSVSGSGASRQEIAGLGTVALAVAYLAL